VTDDRRVSIKDSYTAGVRKAAVPLAERIVAGSHVSANALTIAGLVLSVCTVPFIVSGHFIVAALVLLAASVCDMLDGAVARAGAQVTPFGAFLDSTSDRLAEGVVLGAIGVWYARQDDFWMLGVVFVVLVCSFLVSYTRARAEGLGVEAKVGMAQRAERIVFLGVPVAIFGVGPGGFLLLGILAWLTIVSWITVGQRILHVQTVTRESDAEAMRAAAQHTPVKGT